MAGSPGPITDAQAALGGRLDAATCIVVFTGAGISTECGVPDFRSPGSPWHRHPPIPFAAFLASAPARVEAWKRKLAMDDIYAGAQPGRTHRAVAALAAAGRVDTVITQNIDGLHQAAGLDPARLVELHGNGTYARCLTCGTRHEIAAVRARLAADGLAPACACGGMVKSATVAFGQPLPPEALARARAAALACDLFLVLGSSLVVRPAATLPLIAAQAGARLVIVNREPTPLDDHAELVIRADIGSVLEPWSGALGPAAAPDGAVRPDGQGEDKPPAH